MAKSLIWTTAHEGPDRIVHRADFSVAGVANAPGGWPALLPGWVRTQTWYVISRDGLTGAVTLIDEPLFNLPDEPVAVGG